MVLGIKRKVSGGARTGTLFLLAALLMVLSCLPSTALAEVASGTCGTCAWSIDDRGCLTISAGVLQGNAPSEDYDFDEGYWPWDDYREEITSVRLTGKVTVDDSHSLAYIFNRCYNMTSADLAYLDTSAVRYMDGMFLGCSSLATLDLSSWNTSSVVDMYLMFNGCDSLVSLNIAPWDVSRVRDMSLMFYGCNSLATLDVSSWNTSSVRSFYLLFGECGALTNVDVLSWDTSMAVEMFGMFYCCPSLTSVETWAWETSSVQDTGCMFEGCSSLASLDLSGWDTSSITAMQCMFYGCSSLASLDLSDWDTSSVTDTDDMFEGCSSLTTWKIGRGYQIKSAHMVPDATSPSGWFSSADSVWYSKDEIVSSRSGVADTYTSTGTVKKIDISDATIAKIPDQAYNGGNEVRPAPTVTMELETLVAGTDYTVSYSNNENEGTATVTVTGIGDYTGSESANFKIKYMKPSWSGATKMPVSSTASYSVTNGGYIRVKVDGKRAKSDSVVSISGKTVTAKGAGTTTVYLLDSKGKQIASKKVTVFKAHGKTYEMQSSVDKNYVLDIQGGSTGDGAQMIVYKRNNGKNQRYQFYLQGDGSYAIRSLKSKKWLTVESETDKYVQQWAWKGDGSQLWRLTVDSSNRVTFVNVGTKKCFDVQGGKTKNSVKMIVWPSNGGKNQKWVLNQK